MANWTDGPEYAPAQRPVAFETPPAEPLEVPPPEVNLAAGAPIEQPAWQPPQANVAPLDALAPKSSLPPRDPTTQFTTTSSVATAGSSAWGSAHSTTGTLDKPGWTPDQPLTTSGSTPPNATSWAPPTGTPMAGGAPAATQQQVPTQQALNYPPPQQHNQAFPQHGTPDWFAPPSQGQWRPPDQTVTVAEVWRGATPGVMITLLIGGLIGPLSVVMLGLAALLATRVRYRLQNVRRTMGITFGVLAVIGAFSLLNSDLDLETAWSVISGWAQLACWVVGIVIAFQVGAGIRANERPARP